MGLLGSCAPSAHDTDSDEQAGVDGVVQCRSVMPTEAEMLELLADTRVWTLAGMTELRLAADASSIEIQRDGQVHLLAAKKGYFFSDPVQAQEGNCLFLFQNEGSPIGGVSAREVLRVTPAPAGRSLAESRADVVLDETLLNERFGEAFCSALYGASNDGTRLLIEINALDKERSSGLHKRLATWPYGYIVESRELQRIAP